MTTEQVAAYLKKHEKDSFSVVVRSLRCAGVDAKQFKEAYIVYVNNG